MPVYKDIRGRRSYAKFSHHDFWIILLRVYNGLLGNAYFPKTPIALAVFKAKIDEYLAAISATLGRATIDFAKRNSIREELEKMLFLLTAYVELQSNNDPNIFDTSGIERMSSKRKAPEPLEKPGLPKVAHGFKSGQLRVWPPKSDRKIIKADVRHAEVDANGVPIGDWTEKLVTNFQGPLTIENLKPGARYAFQVRALGKVNETDWSDSVIKMCI